MKTLEKTTKELTTWLQNHSEIESVSLGDISEVDLGGATHFPLAHLIYLSTTYPSGVRTFNYQILLLDKFIESRDNKIEVISRMDEVASEFVSSLYGGGLFSSLVRVNTTPNSQVMYDQLKNRLFGVSLNISVKVPYVKC